MRIRFGRPDTNVCRQGVCSSFRPFLPAYTSSCRANKIVPWQLFTAVLFIWLMTVFLISIFFYLCISDCNTVNHDPKTVKHKLLSRVYFCFVTYRTAQRYLEGGGILYIKFNYRFANIFISKEINWIGLSSKNNPIPPHVLRTKFSPKFSL